MFIHKMFIHKIEHKVRLWHSWPSNLMNSAVTPAHAEHTLSHHASRMCIAFSTHRAYWPLGRQLCTREDVQGSVAKSHELEKPASFA